MIGFLAFAAGDHPLWEAFQSPSDGVTRERVRPHLVQTLRLAPSLRECPASADS